MAWTQSDLDSIDRAIASGELSVRFAGPPERFVTYRSIDELLRARAVIAASLASEAGTVPVRLIRLGSSKGY